MLSWRCGQMNPIVSEDNNLAWPGCPMTWVNVRLDSSRIQLSMDPIPGTVHQKNWGLRTDWLITISVNVFLKTGILNRDHVTFGPCNTLELFSRIKYTNSPKYKQYFRHVQRYLAGRYAHKMKFQTRTRHAIYCCCIAVFNEIRHINKVWLIELYKTKTATCKLVH